MSTVTDAEVEAALQSWFKDGSAWNRQMTPEVQQYMRASMRAAIEAAKAVRVKAESNLQKVQIPTSTIPEGFIPWHAGEPPVAEGTVVSVRLRSQVTFHEVKARHVGWDGSGKEPWGIIAYRIHKPADFRLEAGKFYVTASGERVGTLWLAHEKDIIGRLRYTNGRDEWAFDGTCVYDPRLNILALSSNQESGHDP
jgi:hypothetical protein